MAENQMNEAMEKLNRGIQESKRAAQQQTLELAQEYFDDSVEALKQQIKDNRATLRNLPEQIPGGQEEPFQTMFQELMDNYGKMEDALNEAKSAVADLDPEQIRRQGEVNATDAARRDARELGIDLTEIEGTGSDGRVTVDDVKDFAEAAEDGAAGEEGGLDASDAARREAEELGVDLSQVEGSGSGGRIIVSDVVEASKDEARRKAEELGVDLSQVEGSGSGGLITVQDVTSMAEGAQEQATTGQAAQEAQDAAGQAVQEAQDTAGDTAQQVQDAAGQAADQAQETAQGTVQQAQAAAGQATDQAGQAVQGVQDTAGQVTDQATGALGGVTDQVGQAAQGIQETAGQATQQAQDAAGQATEQAGQAAGEDGAEEPKATNAARRKAEELGVDLSQVQGTGAGGLITIRDVTGS